ncbi:MAG TPA: class I SAM-dependent RNA methyltransferase [Blastocatellia bacterium]|nr:class I SAM-dependent RNA methyltransferase [Blastocatellia bacterium]
MNKVKPSGETFEVTIEKVVYGGDGLGRHDGQTIFVPFSAPGDHLLVRTIESRRNFKRAVIEKIILPSPLRRDPPCEHFGVCGGCHLQHLSYQAHLDSKVSFVRESLRRMGHIDWSQPIPIISSDEFGYRARAQFKIDRGAQRIGFYKTGSHEVRDISYCPLLRSELNEQLTILRNDRSALSEINEVELAAGENGISFWRNNSNEDPNVITQKVGDIEYHFDAQTFFQVNPLILDKLVATAIDDEAGELAVDLYSGVGLFTVPLSKRFGKVIAVEGNERSVKFAAENLRLNGCSNVDLYAKSVEDWAIQYSNTVKSVDLVLVDPPRAGIEQTALESILDMKPSRVSYVSCDPTTLARDLGRFIAAGYAIQSVTALDMFPQTYHIETVVKLSLK